MGSARIRGMQQSSENSNEAEQEWRPQENPLSDPTISVPSEDFRLPRQNFPTKETSIPKMTKAEAEGEQEGDRLLTYMTGSIFSVFGVTRSEIGRNGFLCSKH